MYFSTTLILREIILIELRVAFLQKIENLELLNSFTLISREIRILKYFLILAAFRPSGPQLLTSGIKCNKFGHTDTYGHIRTYGHLALLAQISHLGQPRQKFEKRATLGPELSPIKHSCKISAL